VRSRSVSRFEAVLLDYANTVVQFDRPQIEAIHVALAAFLSHAVAPIDARSLGAVMDRVCVAQPRSEDKRELAPHEQMRRIVQAAYGRRFRACDQVVVDADRVYQDGFVSSLQIDEPTLDALARVCRSMPVGLVSNYPCGTSLRRSLAMLGIADRLDPVVISGEVGYCKPHPRLFQIALEGLGVAADAVLFVGDSWESDMVGAHAAGMATCHHVGLAAPEDHEQRYASYRPDFTIRNLGELDGILAGFVGGRA
jgi:putative hydrolase of the HAD superfamily